MGSPLYVAGNACLYNQASISGGPLQIGASLSYNSPQNSVGTLANPLTTGVHIGGGCRIAGVITFHALCTAADAVFANPLPDTAVQAMTTPQPDWTKWYLNASPGPYYPCVSKTGTPPVGQSLTTYPFPTLVNVPAATPGNQGAYATAQPPQSFSG